MSAAALEGRTALVTGAGNGLGRAIALGLAGAGAEVVLVGRTRAKLEETAALLPDPSRGRVAVCDVSAAESVAALRDELADRDVSVLINNAGIGGPVRPLVEIETSEWDEVFDANVRSVFLMCRAFLPPMTARGTGDVINVASVSGKRPLTRRTPYTASKMAVIGLTRTLAFEAGPLGVSVNSLSPDRAGARGWSATSPSRPRPRTPRTRRPRRPSSRGRRWAAWSRRTRWRRRCWRC